MKLIPRQIAAPFLSLWRHHRFLREYPELEPFIDMGLGIEARERRCRKYWSRHLNLTRSFISQSLARFGKVNSVAILGAGRLYDIDLESISQSASEITLIDADPGVLDTWRSACQKLNGATRFEQHIFDVTGCLRAWSDALLETLQTAERDELRARAIECLSNFEAPIPEFPGRFDVILSVNLVSQLPIYWCDAVKKILRRQASMLPDEHDRFDSGVQQALEATFEKLQLRHLDIIGAYAKRGVILITDRLFHFYSRDVTPWQSELALYGKASRLEVPNFDKDVHDQWLWHVAPQEIENDGYGSIHDVIAWRYNCT